MKQACELIELYRLSYLNEQGCPYSLDYDSLTLCVERLILAYQQGAEGLKIEVLVYRPVRDYAGLKDCFVDSSILIAVH
jgi:hypothetical protein